MLGQIHKKQTPVVPVRKPPPPDKQADKGTPEKAQSPTTSQATPVEAPKPIGETAPKSHNPLPLKCFFLLVSIGLFVSTLTGLYMSYKYLRNRRLIIIILLGGIIFPVLLTVF
jgi:hypothetical protein